MKRLWAFLLIVCLALSGCARQPEDSAVPDQVIDPPSSSPVTPQDEPSQPSNPAPVKVTELGAEGILRVGETEPPGQGITLAQFALSLNLLRHAEKGQNALLSPLSASAALVLAANGAGGQTLHELLALLGASSPEEMNRQYGHWFDTATRELLFANSLWVKAGVEVKEEYPALCKRYFDASLFQGIDRSAINGWVSEKTAGKITEFPCNPDAEVHLINALAMELSWAKGFTENGEEPFTDYAGVAHTLPEMKGKAEHYFELENAVGFTKAYADSPYAFAAILPEGDLYSFLDGLTPETLQAALQSKISADVTVEMPPFRSATEADLAEALSKMGISSAFRPGADFSGISEGLYIGEVLQKCVIDVNEKGTAAAATTDAALQKYGMDATVYRTVKLNRPFIYLLLDTRSDLPVFIGTVATF